MDVNPIELVVMALIGLVVSGGFFGLMGWNAAKNLQRKRDQEAAFTRAARNEADRKALAHEHAIDSAIPDDDARRARARARADAALGQDDDQTG